MTRQPSQPAPAVVAPPVLLRCRRRLPWLWSALLVLPPGFWLHRNLPALHPVLEVEVAGEFHHLRPAQLRRVVEQRLHGGLLAVDLAEIRAALLSEGWVETVTVRRLWPDRLQVLLREQRPVARWGEEGFLNPRGELFRGPGNAATAELPLLRGPPGSTRRMLYLYLPLRQRLAAAGLYLHGLELNRRGAWTAELQSGTRILLGSTDLELRVRRLLRYVAVLPDEDKARLRRIDLRYDNGLAVPAAGGDA